MQHIIQTKPSVMRKINGRHFAVGSLQQSSTSKKIQQISKIILLTILLITNHQSLITLNAQVGVNDDNSSPAASAMLDVKSTTKGMLVPRMTTSQRDVISSPATGLMVYNTTTNAFNYYNGIAWVIIGQDNLGNHKATQNIELNGQWLSGDGDNEGIQVNANGNVGVCVAPQAKFEVDMTGTIAQRMIDIAPNTNDFTSYSYPSQQSFTAPYSCELKKIFIYVGGFPTFLGNQTLTLHQGDLSGGGGTPINNPNPIATATGNVQPNTWVEFNFPAGITLNANQKYSISIRVNNWNYNNSNPYSGGDDFFSSLFDRALRVDAIRKRALKVEPDGVTISQYKLPAIDGTNGQVLQTNGSGSLSWSNPTINTDNQILSLNSNTLSLTNGGSVNLSGLNTDNQTLDVSQLNGTNLELSLSNDGQATKSISLSNFMDNTDNQTLDVAQLNGNNLELSLSNDGQATKSISLNSFMEDRGSLGHPLRAGVTAGTLRRIGPRNRRCRT